MGELNPPAHCKSGFPSGSVLRPCTLRLCNEYSKPHCLELVPREANVAGEKKRAVDADSAASPVLVAFEALALDKLRLVSRV